MFTLVILAQKRKAQKRKMELFRCVSRGDHFQEINEALNSMRRQDKFSDLVFVCHDAGSNSSVKTISAHQFMFTSLSNVLGDLFRISQLKQPYEKIVITLDSVDPIVVEKLVEYLYEGETKVSYQQECELIDLCELLQLDVPLRDFRPSNFFYAR